MQCTGFAFVFVFLLFLVGQDKWKGEDVSPSHFKCYNSCALSYTYRYFLPSGHPIFLLLLNNVINICIPLTSRQLKPFPERGKGPAVETSLGGGYTEPLLVPVSSVTAKKPVYAPRCLTISQQQPLSQASLCNLPLLSVCINIKCKRNHQNNTKFLADALTAVDI